jgi:hypothetical protein
MKINQLIPYIQVIVIHMCANQRPRHIRWISYDIIAVEYPNRPQAEATIFQ